MQIQFMEIGLAAKSEEDPYYNSGFYCFSVSTQK